LGHVLRQGYRNDLGNQPRKHSHLYALLVVDLRKTVNHRDLEKQQGSRGQIAQGGQSILLRVWLLNHGETSFYK
jgi:hypothetical protein